MAQSEWAFDFESVGDPHHEIIETCQTRGWLELFINTHPRRVINRESSIYAHPKGYFQPGVLALDSSGRVLYRWRGVPTRKNMGGATERPTAAHVFENIRQALDASDCSDAKLDENPKLDSRGLPWPVFLSLLTANGWFIKPKPFPYLSKGPTVAHRAKRAMVRIPIFIAAWVVAFLTLPPVWVGAALLGYAAWLTPHIREINRYFQNEKVPET